MSIYRHLTRDIIQALRIAPRLEEDDDHGYPVHPRPGDKDEPEGKIFIRVSDTLANEWADTLEKLLESE